MILSTVRLMISPQERSEVLRILRVFMGHTTARTGCAGFSVSQDLTNHEVITISERWLVREQLDEHVRSAEYRLLLAVIDLSVTSPEISFDELGHLGGLDVVQALRAPRTPDSEGRQETTGGDCGRHDDPHERSSAKQP
jgi:quinol monooxygenase YgiN